jgi:hypothetical protein
MLSGGPGLRPALRWLSVEPSLVPVFYAALPVYFVILGFLSGASQRLTAAVVAETDKGGVSSVTVVANINGVGASRYGGRLAGVNKGHGKDGQDGRK